MNIRRVLIRLTALVLVVCLLGCTDGHTSSKTEPTTPTSGESSPVSEFEAALQAQSSLTLDDFLTNYERACALVGEGIVPDQPMTVFDAETVQQDHASVVAANGLYAVKLDPKIFGTSTFYVIPAGLRPMTADEYLALAQYANISADVLVQKENSWIRLQTGSGTANRIFSAKERFWMYYQYYDKLLDREQLPVQPDAPISIPVGCGSDVSDYTLYPTADMSAYALQTAVEMLCSRMPSEQQAVLLPSINELSWEAAVDAAIMAMANHADHTEMPARNYVQYSGHMPMAGTRQSGVWNIALYYSDGSSYQINIDSISGEINNIYQMPGGALDYATQWNDDQTFYDGTIIYSK